jgi:calmodulin
VYADSKVTSFDGELDEILEQSNLQTMQEERKKQYIASLRSRAKQQVIESTQDGRLFESLRRVRQNPEERRVEGMAKLRMKAKQSLGEGADRQCLKQALQAARRRRAGEIKQSHLNRMRTRREKSLLDKCPEEAAFKHEEAEQSSSLQIDRVRCQAAWKRMSSGGEIPTDDMMSLLKMAGQKRGDQAWVDKIMAEHFLSRSTLDEEDFWAFIDVYEVMFREFIEAEFKKADADDSGSINAGEMSSLLRTLGFTPAPWTVQELIHEITGVDGGRAGLTLGQFIKLNDLLLKRAGFTRSEVMQIKALFMRYDRSGDGTIDADELKAAFSWCGFALYPENLVDQLISEVDRDQSGSLDETEFITIMRHHREHEIQELQRAFGESDLDHSGTVDAQELPRIFDELGYAAAKPVIVKEGIRKCGLLPATEGEYLFEDVYILLDWFRVNEGFSEADMAELKEAFEMYGHEGKDRIGGMDLGNAIRWMGYPQTVEQLMDALEEFDTDENGAVAFPEFLKIMRYYREVDVKRVRDKFKERDADGSGSLCMPELKQVLMHLGHTPCMKELKVMFKELCGDKEEVELWDLEKLVDGYRLEARERFRKHCGFIDREVQKYNHEFQKHDPQKDGFIDGKDLRKLLTKLFPAVDKHPEGHAKVRSVMAQIEGGDGKLDFDEYLKLMRVLQDEEEMQKYNREKDAIVASRFSRTEVAEFRQVFQMFDEDKSGRISFDEFSSLLTQIFPENIVKGAKMKRELEELLLHSHLDQDSEDTELDFPDFLLAMRKIQDENFAGINDKVAGQAGT